MIVGLTYLYNSIFVQYRMNQFLNAIFIVEVLLNTIKSSCCVFHRNIMIASNFKTTTTTTRSRSFRVSSRRLVSKLLLLSSGGFRRNWAGSYVYLNSIAATTTTTTAATTTRSFTVVVIVVVSTDIGTIPAATIEIDLRTQHPNMLGQRRATNTKHISVTPAMHTNKQTSSNNKQQILQEPCYQQPPTLPPLPTHTHTHKQEKYDTIRHDSIYSTVQDDRQLSPTPTLHLLHPPPLPFPPLSFLISIHKFHCTLIYSHTIPYHQQHHIHNKQTTTYNDIKQIIAIPLSNESES